MKLYGRATEVSTEIRDGCAAGWWHARPDAAVVLALGIEQAASIECDLKDGPDEPAMLVAKPGLIETSRTYPYDLASRFEIRQQPVSAGGGHRAVGRPPRPARARLLRAPNG